MALDNLFTDFALELDADVQSGTPVFINGIQDMAINSELQTFVEGGDGALFNSFGSLIAGAPTGRLSTVDLKAFLDACGTTGMAIASVTQAGVRAIFQKYLRGGTREAAASTVHVTALFGDGIMVPRTLSMSHQDTSRLTAEIIGASVSANPPIVIGLNNALPAPAVFPAITEEWTLGAVFLDTVRLEGVRSVTIDFGIDILTESGDSDLFPTFVSIRRIQPIITFAQANLNRLGTITANGQFLTSGKVRVHALKRVVGGTVASDVTAEHIRFTMGPSRVDWASIDGDPKSLAGRIMPWAIPGSSPTDPMTINTAIAQA